MKKNEFFTPGVQGGVPGIPGEFPLWIPGGLKADMGLKDPGPGAQGLKADGPQGPGPRGPGAILRQFV